jgi:aminopeptidase N
MSTAMTTAEPWSSLTRDDAAERARSVSDVRVLVELDLSDPSSPTFRSTTTVWFRCTAAETFLDVKAHELIACTLNGEPLPPAAWRAGRIRLTGLQPENVVMVDGLMRYTNDGEGLCRHVDPEDQQTYLYAMSFLAAAPLWFACFDQPDLKATFELLVTAPPSWVVLGNGPSEAVTPGHWRIVPLAPLSTYVVTLVAGPYASVYDDHNGLRLGLHTRAALGDQLRAQAPDILEVTRQSFDYYHRTFDIRYPFGEYHQAFVPDFNAGAMENPGCVVLRDGFIFRGRATEADRARRAGGVAHELAHMWFGDLVTMRWWDDLWLNESFAEYLAHRCCTVATRYPLWTEFGIIRKDWGSVADQSSSTHPVASNGAEDAESALHDFDGISYAKGAAVVKQLAAYVGEQVFLDGLRSYVDRYAHRNAAFPDLIQEWVSAGASGLDQWADRWLRSAGMDTIDVSSRPRSAIIKRSGPGGVQRAHALAVGVVDDRGVVRVIDRVVLDGAEVPVTVPDDAVLVVPDATDATWAKIRFGEHGWSRVAEVLPRVVDQPVLVVIYNAIRDAVREATLDPAEALDLVCRGIPCQDSDVVTGQLLAFAIDQLAGAYCPVADRPSRLARVHQTCRGLLAARPARSDAQLTAFRLCVRSASDAGLLRRWQVGELLPPGITLDPELGWEIVERIAGLVADPEVIEQALARDGSSSAHVHAARARARLASPEAKAAAWRDLMGPSTLSAYELYALGEGFFDPGQAALTAPFVSRYFAEVGDLAAFRTGWALRDVASKASPWSAAEPETVRLAEQTLSGDLAPAVRRAMVDATDKLRRATASLEVFG